MLNKIKDKIEPGVVFVVSIFFISRILIFFMGYLSNLVIIKSAEAYKFIDPIFASNIFFKWDSMWYMSIIEKGYSFNPNGASNIGFFPFYPLVVKLLSIPFGHPVFIGFTISNLAFLFAGIYLYKLVKLDFDDFIARKSILFMFIVPTGLFFSIFYTEGLFIFLTISSFYYARKRQWLIASILGGFSSITKAFGFIIFIPILIEYLNLEQVSFKESLRNLKLDVLYLFFIPLTLLMFLIYQYFRFNDPFAFIHAQQIGWHKGSLTFLGSIIHGNFLNYSLFYQIITIVSGLIAIILLFHQILYKQRVSYKFYSGGIILLYLLTSLNEVAMPRYLSGIFTVYISLALIAREHKIMDYIITWFSIALLTIFVVLFVNGYLMV